MSASSERDGAGSGPPAAHRRADHRLRLADGGPKEALPEFGKSTPPGRAGPPTELTPAYVFLTSFESSYVLGETLAVTGGSPSP